MKIKESYALDDLLLVPKYSEIESRSDVDLSVDLGKGVKLDIPITNANMVNIASPKLVQTVAMSGGLGLLHRFCSIQEAAQDYMKATGGFKELVNRIGVSVGIRDEDFDRVDELVGKRGARIVCIDIAHADSSMCIEMVKYIHNSFPDILLIVGNVAILGAALRLVDAGADVIKIGIGSGSICTTRINTGVGVPSFTALSEIQDWRKRIKQGEKKQYPFKTIADGGLKNSGDIAKALCLADCCMIGRVISGTDECPGEEIMIDGIPHKEYNGSSTLKNTYIEGVKSYAPYQGSVKNVIEQIMQGVRSCCSYQNAQNIDELQEDPEWVKISHAGIIESNSHSVKIKI